MTLKMSLNKLKNEAILVLVNIKRPECFQRLPQQKKWQKNKVKPNLDKWDKFDTAPSCPSPVPVIQIFHFMNVVKWSIFYNKIY